MPTKRVSRIGRIARIARIVRTPGPLAPESLALEVDRRLAMVMGSDGLERIEVLERQSGSDAMLVEIGYTLEYIELQRALGVHFWLISAESHGLDVRTATWSNVIEMAMEAYPEVSTLIASGAAKISDVFDIPDVSDLERRLGYRLADIDKLGPDDERFMTLARFAATTGDADCLRRFFYHCLRLSELFSGDGFTYRDAAACQEAVGEQNAAQGIINGTAQGVTLGIAEYVTRNYALRELPGLSVREL